MCCDEQSSAGIGYTESWSSCVVKRQVLCNVHSKFVTDSHRFSSARMIQTLQRDVMQMDTRLGSTRTEKLAPLGLVSTIRKESPELNWIYVDQNTEVQVWQHRVLGTSSHHVIGQRTDWHWHWRIQKDLLHWTRQRRLGFCIVIENI